MPGSRQSSHTHKLAGKFVHPVTAPSTSRQDPTAVRDLIRHQFQHWGLGEVSLTELWGVGDICGACAGSKRYLVACLGGWGDVKRAGVTEVILK